MNKLSKADFGAFTKIAKEHKEKNLDDNMSSKTTNKSEDFRYLQVRLTKNDANRLKSIIVSKGFSVQSVLIEALNYWMQDLNQSPLLDPGTGRTKK